MYVCTNIFDCIDECSDGTHNCSQICINTNGSFICECNGGFLLDTDRATCKGMQKNMYMYIYIYIVKCLHNHHTHIIYINYTYSNT